MVAESPHKPSNAHQKRSGERGPGIPFALRLKVRNLYLGQNLSHQELAERSGLRKEQVAKLICTDRLAVEKRRRQEKIVASNDARTGAMLEAFNTELAEQAEEISLGALERARQEVESSGEFAPKNFQAWTGGISNLVKASRAVRGLDSRSAQSEGASLSIYIVRGELIGQQERPEPRNVTPVTPCAVPTAAALIETAPKAAP